MNPRRHPTIYNPVRQQRELLLRKREAVPTAYTSRTGTRSTISALRAHGWRFLVTPNAPRTEGMPYCLDNGAWTAFNSGQPWSSDTFCAMVERLGLFADWVVVPDVVGDWVATKKLFQEWAPFVRNHAKHLLLAVQDGARTEEAIELLGPRDGVFLGGSTDWKLSNMLVWGLFCARHRRHYHVARVNSRKRILMARSCGADSFDGNSPTMFPCTLPALDAARRETIHRRPHAQA